jgi:hypothetical protein
MLTSGLQENILMQIRGDGSDGLRDEDGQQGASASGERVVYVLHPNCAVDVE